MQGEAKFKDKDGKITFKKFDKGEDVGEITERQYNTAMKKFDSS